MGGFSGLSLQYFHAVKIHLAPTSAKLRRVLPYFTTKAAGEIIHTATPPPAKQVPGGTPTLHLYIALAAQKAAAAAAADAAAEGGQKPAGVQYDEKLAVTYTDGTELEFDLDSLATAHDVLARIERKAKELKSKDDAAAV